MKRIFAFALLLAAVACAAAQNWALVNIPVAHIRSDKSNKAELTSQELLGMPVQLIGENGEWWQVKTADGYTGWMRKESVTPISDTRFDNWRKADRLIVSSLGETKAYASPQGAGVRDIVTELLPGNIVLGSIDMLSNGRVQVSLPDGREAWVDAAVLTPLSQWASQPFDVMKVLNQAYFMMGKPYLWGGYSVKALDCSGLSKFSYLANGIILRRDAYMQAETGQKLPTDDWTVFQPGDLLFFGNKATGRVTHVGIYDSNGKFVHSTGTGDRVRVNSLKPGDPDFYRLEVMKASRIQGMENTDGIVKADSHPWLFSTNSSLKK